MRERERVYEVVSRFESRSDISLQFYRRTPRGIGDVLYRSLSTRNQHSGGEIMDFGFLLTSLVFVIPVALLIFQVSKEN